MTILQSIASAFVGIIIGIGSLLGFNHQQPNLIQAEISSSTSTQTTTPSHQIPVLSNSPAVSQIQSHSSNIPASAIRFTVPSTLTLHPGDMVVSADGKYEIVLNSVNPNTAAADITIVQVGIAFNKGTLYSNNPSKLNTMTAGNVTVVYKGWYANSNTITLDVMTPAAWLTMVKAASGVNNSTSSTPSSATTSDGTISVITNYKNNPLRIFVTCHANTSSVFYGYSLYPGDNYVTGSLPTGPQPTTQTFDYTYASPGTYRLLCAPATTTDGIHFTDDKTHFLILMVTVPSDK